MGKKAFKCIKYGEQIVGPLNHQELDTTKHLYTHIHPSIRLKRGKEVLIPGEGQLGPKLWSLNV